jgi:type IV pilus assembly protein PilP
MSKRILLALCAATALIGCTERMSVLREKVETELKKAPPPLAPIPPVMNFPVVELPVEGLRDPFQSPEELYASESSEEMAANDPDCPDLTRIPEILEEHPLDSLNMVGTMSQNNQFYGLVKDPDGEVHRVQVNNYMGQNYGQILSIADDKIVLEERVKDASGCERREQSIALKDNN